MSVCAARREQGMGYPEEKPFARQKRRKQEKRKRISVRFATACLLIVVLAAVVVTLAVSSNREKAAAKAADDAAQQAGAVSVALDKQTVYMPPGGADQIVASVEASEISEETVRWTSSDGGVVVVSGDGALTAVAEGGAVVTATTANGLTASAEVIVSALFQMPEIDNSKPFLTAGLYTQEENDLLDDILLYRIEQAGYGTRAGVVAAARFLALEFPRTIPYFFENGRLNNHSGILYVDGEGRYYHQGLYLHESRCEEIVAAYSGPAVWGERLYSIQTEEYSANGFSCGGFVSWCLLNGGFDAGDSGSGDNAGRDDDLCDLGERVAITEELMRSGRVKPGDFIWLEGHIGIIIGMDEENIYIAEAWQGRLHVDTYERYSGISRTGIYTHIVLMDDVYGEDGNLSESWQ